MVLNKSKWDHKAKISYLKKHNLTRPKPTKETTPKWSAKRSNDPQQASWLGETDDSDSDWDSEDEAFLNHFYPQISEDRLSEVSKRKLKRQIVRMVKRKENGNEEEPHETTHDEADGIYLGSTPNTNDSKPQSHSDDEDASYSDEEFELEIPDFDAKLSEFVVSDMGKSRNRKLLKNKISDNLLEEYGLDSYTSTVKNTDYNNSAKQKYKNVERLTAADLHGLKIGETKTEPTQSQIRSLDEAELEAHKARAQKLEHVKFHNQIKRKFGDSPVVKPNVLEINNFNADDETQMASLNSKLTSTNTKSSNSTAPDEDLDELLGLKCEKPTESSSTDTQDFLSAMLPTLNNQKKDTNRKQTKKTEASTDKFLDDLLGI